jgi:hypothetical protein
MIIFQPILEEAFPPQRDRPRRAVEATRDLGVRLPVGGFIMSCARSRDVASFVYAATASELPW